jgi:S1-C subfamily serine protease
MTKDEVNKLIAGLEQNVTVNGGNDYNITINSTESKNLLAASKALLSAVSITCTFKITVSTIFGNTGVQEKQTAGAGVIYRLDKESGDAYIITNYHVVYLNGANTEDSISDDIKVYLYGQEYEQYAIYADYIGGSKNYDIAVLKVKGSNVLRESNAVAAEFADSNDVCSWEFHFGKVFKRSTDENFKN